MTNEEREVLLNKVQELRKANIDSEYGQIPESISYLKGVLNGAKSEDKAAIYDLLIDECVYAKNNKFHLEILREQVRDFPESPLPLVSLALKLSMGHGENPTTKKEAVHLLTQGLILAKRQNRLIRYTASYMARIAIMLNDYLLLRHAICELIEDVENWREEDTAYEFDFVGQIDESRLGRELLGKYKMLVGRRASPPKSGAGIERA